MRPSLPGRRLTQFLATETAVVPGQLRFRLGEHAGNEDELRQLERIEPVPR